jgi:hypothetical protein
MGTRGFPFPVWESGTGEGPPLTVRVRRLPPQFLRLGQALIPTLLPHERGLPAPFLETQIPRNARPMSLPEKSASTVSPAIAVWPSPTSGTTPCGR